MSRIHPLFPLLVLCLLFAAPPGAAADAPAAPKTGRVTVAFSFDAPRFSEAGGETRVRLDDTLTRHRPGEPLVPFRTAKVLLPPGSEVRGVRAIPGGAPETLKLDRPLAFARTPLPPSLGREAVRRISQQDRPLAAVYASDAPYPAERAELLSVQRWHGCDIAIVRVFPLQYHPKSGRLLFAPRLTLEVSVAPKGGGGDPYAGFGARGHLAEVAGFVDNPAAVSGYIRGAGERRRSSEALCDYLLITSEALFTPFQPLLERKEACGLRVMRVDSRISTPPGSTAVAGWLWGSSIDRRCRRPVVIATPKDPFRPLGTGPGGTIAGGLPVDRPARVWYRYCEREM